MHDQHPVLTVVCAAMMLLLLLNLIMLWLIWTSRQKDPPESVVRAIVEDADQDEPPMTTKDWTAARYVSELSDRRDYWREAFISWVRRGDRRGMTKVRAGVPVGTLDVEVEEVLQVEGKGTVLVVGRGGQGIRATDRVRASGKVWRVLSVEGTPHGGPVGLVVKEDRG